MTTPTRFALGCLLGGLFAASAAADVITVGPAGDFTTIKAAAAAAANGDTVLVAAGDYSVGSFNSPIEVDGKGLVITAERNALVLVSRLHVSNLPAGQTVVIRGLSDAVELLVEDCVGSVRIEDVQGVGVNGGGDCAFPVSGSPVTPGQAAISIQNSDAVAITRCTVAGGAGKNAADPFVDTCSSDGGAGIEITNSTVVLDGCSCTGGDGGLPFDVFNKLGGHGGAGIEVADSTIWVLGGTQTGGDTPGHDDFVCGFFPDNCEGGAGLHVADNLSFANLRDVDLLAGSGASTGPDLDAPIGTVAFLSAAARGLVATSPLREGESGELAFSGVTGELVLLLWSGVADFAPLAANQGVLLTGADALGHLLAFGPIDDVGGSLAVPISIPAVLGGIDAVSLHMQAAYIGSEGNLLGGWSVLTVVNDAFPAP